MSGPAVRVDVKLSNGSPSPISLADVSVTLSDAQGDPAVLVSTGTKPLTGTLAAGAVTTGSYVFTVATTDRHPVTLAVSYRSGVPTVQFRGDAPS